MLTHPIPPRLNGFYIIAKVPLFADPTMVTIILGYDPERRHGKYCTAQVGVGLKLPAPTEWYWGHYFEDFTRAMQDLIFRANVPALKTPENVL